MSLQTSAEVTYQSGLVTHKTKSTLCATSVSFSIVTFVAELLGHEKLGYFWRKRHENS